MRALVRTLMVALLCVALASPAGAARRGDRPTRDELEGQRAEQQRLADDLRAERKNVELALSFMAKRDDALQSRLIARTSRDERTPYEAWRLDQAPPTQTFSGPIPVVTDFTCPI